eukprot:jgi/Chlat1/3745/Chrsp259S03889
MAAMAGLLCLSRWGWHALLLLLVVASATAAEAAEEAGGYPTFPDIGPDEVQCVGPEPITSPPQLKWTAQAESLVLKLLQSTQYPVRGCEQANILIAKPFGTGLFSSINSWRKMLVLALALNRTLVALPDPDNDAGCESGPNPIRQFLPTATDPRPSSPQPRVLLANYHRGLPHHDYVCTTDFAPWLWDAMTANGWVYASGGGSILQVSPLERQFMLHSIIARWFFVPDHAILYLAARIKAKLRLKWKTPIAGVHIRQTDKKREDRFFRAEHSYRPLSEFAAALLAHASAAGNTSYGAVAIMSDAESTIQEVAADPAAHGFPANVSVLYNDLLDRSEVERRGGHKRIAGLERLRFQQHFLAMMLLVLRNAEHVVVTYSSNVGRFMVEYLAAVDRTTQTQPVGRCGSSVEHEGDKRDRWKPAP